MKHDSFICWMRGTEVCEHDCDQVLFIHADGEKEPCTCKCHKKR